MKALKLQWLVVVSSKLPKNKSIVMSKEVDCDAAALFVASRFE